MDGENHGARVFFFLDALELSGEELELEIGDGRPFAGFAGNDAGVFQSVGEKADDADEGAVERKVDAGLGHGGAVKRAGFLGDGGSAAQKLREKIFSG